MKTYPTDHVKNIVLLGNSGSGKTTLEEIARDIRIGKATIYHYFSSKDELYYECPIA